VPLHDRGKITVVEKNENRVNFPEGLPNENFWIILEQMVDSDAWLAKTLKELKLHILKCIKRIGTNQVFTFFD
jgi:hypothetical protein